ncbi:hypothetical protein AB4W76_27220 [Klebsiella pasteurii]|uniref:hypothetical protein n=1 Tax=Klebsiella pasteurii TaxID=2587529 RepID=UPI003AB45246
MPLSTWSGGGGRVYQTSVPGISVVLARGSVVYSPSSNISFPQLDATYTTANESIGHGYQLILIKIGPVSSGAVNGIELPSIISYIPTVTGYTGLPLTIGTVRFPGLLNITKGICSTSDVSVDMGLYNSSNRTVWRSGTGILTVGVPDANVFNVYLQSNSIDVLDAEKGILNVFAPNRKSAAIGFGIEIAWGGGWWFVDEL